MIQKFWDSGAPDAGRLNLVPCGSTISRMEALLAEKNPLYGRKTMAMEVEPLPLRDAARFFPSCAPDEKIAAYAVFGGTPYYLRLCDPDASLEHNVVKLLLTPSAPLIDEPAFLLQSEVKGVQRHASIVAAIADGCTKLGEIAGRVREAQDARGLGPYIDVLARMRIVRAVRSLDATKRERDPLFAFWHRFLRPNISSVVRGFGAEVPATRSRRNSPGTWGWRSKRSAGSARGGTRRNACPPPPRKRAGAGPATSTSTSPDACWTAPRSSANGSGGAARSERARWTSSRHGRRRADTRRERHAAPWRCTPSLASPMRSWPGQKAARCSPSARRPLHAGLDPGHRDRETRKLARQTRPAHGQEGKRRLTAGPLRVPPAPYSRSTASRTSWPTTWSIRTSPCAKPSRSAAVRPSLGLRHSSCARP